LSAVIYPVSQKVASRVRQNIAFLIVAFKTIQCRKGKTKIEKIELRNIKVLFKYDEPSPAASSGGPWHTPRDVHGPSLCLTKGSSTVA
jgi:hypothetical protein